MAIRTYFTLVADSHEFVWPHSCEFVRLVKNRMYTEQNNSLNLLKSFKISACNQFILDVKDLFKMYLTNFEHVFLM